MYHEDDLDACPTLLQRMLISRGRKWRLLDDVFSKNSQLKKKIQDDSAATELESNTPDSSMYLITFPETHINPIDRYSKFLTAHRR